jgi:hypothetical protein
MTPDEATTMKAYFADPATGKQKLPLGDSTKAKLSGLTVGVSPAPKALEAYRDGKRVYGAAPEALAKGLLSIGGYGWNTGKYEIRADGKAIGAFTVTGDVVVKPPVITPPTTATKAQNTICAADVAIKAGAVVVEEGFPFFLHTLGLLPASLSWVPNLPLHNFDFDWSMEGMDRFAQARGRAYAGILSAGTHQGAMIVTHPKTGQHGKLALTVTAIRTARKTATVKNESELRAASATPGTDIHFGASFEITKAIGLASLIRWYGEGYTLTSRIAGGATVIQPRGADGFVGQGFTVDGDADIFFSPNGTRFALVDVMVNRVGHLVNANGKPSAVLMQDCRTRDENSIRKYMGWLDGRYHVIRGCWVDDSRDEHCFRGGLTVSAYDRCWLNNAQTSNSMSKGTITAHTVKDLSIDLCNCGRTGRGDAIGGGEIAFGPLTPDAHTPVDQLTAERISVTRTFMRDGAKVCVKAGTVGFRAQDCATNFPASKHECFTLCDSQQQPILKPASDYAFVNCGPGADQTPKWVNKVVAA